VSEYSFSTLAPNEFEELCRDLLKRHLNVPLQAFATGRDGGIDHRYAPVRGRQWIVQCKHYAGSRFVDLKNTVRNERKKLDRLKPERYLLATSCALTPGNVDELFELLAPYCRSRHDILGRSDLNAIIRENGDIERRHPKLWITSEAVLTRVLQNDVFVQSELTREAILRRISLYVYTNRFREAAQRLDRDRICIISGVPGVGKTTLAEMLLMEYLRDDWELVTIHQNVSEGLRIHQARPGVKQIFYYDDFLGQVSSGEKLSKNEDGALVQLLRDVKYSASKRFILTTREYILAQAKREHEKLARASLDIYRFVVECRDYDEKAKARILANHLYLNEVPREHIAAIVRDKGYEEIIQHDNYNPRLIEAMTNRIELQDVAPSAYHRAFIARLDDPSGLWEHIYEEQLSESCRHVLLAMAGAGTRVRLKTLERDFDSLYGKRCREFAWQRRVNDFERAINDLEGNFIRIRSREGTRTVEWHNPSVLDFLVSWLRRHPVDTEALLAAASRFSQVEALANTAPVLLTADGRSVAVAVDETILAAAIERTLKPVTWSALRTIVRLAERFTQGPVRASAMSAANRRFQSFEIEAGDCASVVAILQSLDNCDWIEKETLLKWRDRVRRSLCDLDPDTFYQLEHFMPLAKWVAEQRWYLTEGELDQFQRLSNNVVRTEVNASFAPNYESIWVEMKQRVEELQNLLSMDFGEEIRAIERGMEHAERPEPDESRVIEALHGERRTSIDSIFDSLMDGL
jgi:Restriction endonuclease